MGRERESELERQREVRGGNGRRGEGRWERGMYEIRQGVVCSVNISPMIDLQKISTFKIAYMK